MNCEQVEEQLSAYLGGFLFTILNDVEVMAQRLLKCC